MSKKLVASRGMNSNLYLNKPVGGGPKKSGLAPSFLGGSGVSLVRRRSYMGGPKGVQANYKNNDLIFNYKSTIGGIGHNIGGRSLHRMMDGIQSFTVKKSIGPSQYHILEKPCDCSNTYQDPRSGYIYPNCHRYNDKPSIAPTCCTPPSIKGGVKPVCCNDLDCNNPKDTDIESGYTSRCYKGKCIKNNKTAIICPNEQQVCWGWSDNRCCDIYKKCWSAYDCITNGYFDNAYHCRRTKNDEDNPESFGVCYPNPHRDSSY